MRSDSSNSMSFRSVCSLFWYFDTLWPILMSQCWNVFLSVQVLWFKSSTDLSGIDQITVSVRASSSSDSSAQGFKCFWDVLLVDFLDDLESERFSLLGVCHFGLVFFSDGFFLPSSFAWIHHQTVPTRAGMVTAWITSLFCSTLGRLSLFSFLLHWTQRTSSEPSVPPSGQVGRLSSSCRRARHSDFRTHPSRQRRLFCGLVSSGVLPQQILKLPLQFIFGWLQLHMTLWSEQFGHLSRLRKSWQRCRASAYPLDVLRWFPTDLFSVQ